MNNFKKRIIEDFNLTTILLIPIAVAINFIAGSLILTLKLPIYLDMIGTFLVAILAGPWVGCLTGILSIAINSIADPMLFPYTMVAGLLGATTGVLARKKMFTSISRYIISSIIVSVVGVVSALFVNILFFGGFDSSGATLVVAAMMTAGVPFWPAQIITSFITEVPDKLLSLLVPYLVIKRMSDRYLYKFSNGGIFIEARKTKKSK